MQKTVDKQIQDEFARAHAVRRGLFLRFCETDEYLSRLRADFIREDVRDVGFLAELNVQRLRFCRADEDKRYVPVGEDGRGDGRIGKTRRWAPREIRYFYLCHSI